jgi:hypothetical protein
MKVLRYLAPLLAALAVLPSSSHAITQDDVNEIDSFLVGYMKNVNIVKRARDGAGSVVSCVDVHRQPGVNHPLATGSVQLEPSAELKALLGGRVAAAPASPTCPRGSVEMYLPTRDQIIARGSLRNFLAKHPNDNDQRSRPSYVAAPSISGHSYAGLSRFLTATGAQATINVWKPTLAAPTDFSLSQLWVAGGSGASTQTVEAGYQVSPQIYGNSDPNFFIYYTADNYDKLKCYNLTCPAFVQTSSVLPIGGPIPYSTVGSAPLEGTIAWYRDPSSGHWILFLKQTDGSYTQAGYYPVWLFGSGQLSRNATRIDFGGEIYTRQATPTVPMGSGAHPGISPAPDRVAYQRNLLWMDTGGTVRDYYPDLLNVEPINSGCAYGGKIYDASRPYASGWGTSLFFGGPGYVSGC